MKRSKKQFCVGFFAFWLCSVILFTSCNHHLGGDLSGIQVETDLGTIASTETATTDTMDPSVDIPAPEEQYLVMKDFSLQKVNYANFQTEDVVDFSFSELAARLNTVYASDPYVSNLESSIGNPDSRKMNAVLTALQLESSECKKLGLYKLDQNGDPLQDETGEYVLDSEIFAAYGFFDGVVYGIEYSAFVVNSELDHITDEAGEPVYIQNQLLISSETSRGTYYVASLADDMIVEVEQQYLSFLEWEEYEWYDPYVLMYNIAFLTDLEFTYYNQSYDFALDNTLSYAFYEVSQGSWAMVDLNTGMISKNANGDYVYQDKSGARHDVRIVDFSNKDGFFMENQIIYYTDSYGKYELSINSSNLSVYCAQYAEGKAHPNLLDYTILNSYITDAGAEKTELISGVDNFRLFYRTLLYLSIEGAVDPAEFQKNMGMTMEKYVALGDSVCEATLKIHLQDHASVLNQHRDENGEKVWKEDNEKDMIFRFYRYSERKMLVTVEEIEAYDTNGNPISDPTNVSLGFYVSADAVEAIAEAAEMLLNKVLIP